MAKRTTVTIKCPACGNPTFTIYKDGRYCPSCAKLHSEILNEAAEL